MCVDAPSPAVAVLPLRPDELDRQVRVQLVREGAVTWPPERDIIAPVSEAEHAAVRRAQRALNLEETGELDEPTRASLRGTQYLGKLEVTGVLDRRTALFLDLLNHTFPEEGA